jgi:hypothetical protein
MATNTLPEPPAGIDLAQDQRSLIIAVSATTWAIAFVAVTARIAGRVMRGVKLWYDDWFILAALVRIPVCFKTHLVLTRDSRLLWHTSSA